MLKPLARAHDRITEAGLWLGVASLAAIAALSFVATMARYFLGAPIGWVPDWTAYLLAITIFATAPAVTRHGMHVSMDLIASLVRSQNGLRLLALVAGLFTLSVLLVLCGVVAQSLLAAWRAGTSTAAAYPIPRWWLMAVVLYGFAGAAVHTMRGLAALLPAKAPTPPASALSVAKD